MSSDKQSHPKFEMMDDTVPTLPSDAVETDEAELSPRVLTNLPTSDHKTEVVIVEQTAIRDVKSVQLHPNQLVQLHQEEVRILESPVSTTPVRPLTRLVNRPLICAETPRRKKGMVVFGSEVQVVITDTYYSGEQSHKIYQIGFWVHNKGNSFLSKLHLTIFEVVHGIALFCMLLVLIALIAVLAIKWEVLPQFQCDKPLRSILLSDLISLIAMMIFLGGTMIIRSVFSSMRMKNKMARKTVRPETVTVITESSPTTSESSSIGSFCGTPITPIPQKCLAPVRKKDVVVVEPLKTIFHDIHKENEV